MVLVLAAIVAVAVVVEAAVEAAAATIMEMVEVEPAVQGKRSAHAE